MVSYQLSWIGDDFCEGNEYFAALESKRLWSIHESHWKLTVLEEFGLANFLYKATTSLYLWNLHFFHFNYLSW